MKIHTVAWMSLLLIMPALVLDGAEKQLNISTFYDSNPRENIKDIEGTTGLKVKGLIRFNKDSQQGQLYGSVLGQGFLEPALFLDSKFILNADVGGHYKLVPGWRALARLKTFQKIYLEDFQQYSRITMSGSLKRMKYRSNQQEFGLRRSHTQIYSHVLFAYTNEQAYLKLSQLLPLDLQADLNCQIGLVKYEDFPAKLLLNDSLIVSDTDNQKDLSWGLGLHVKQFGKMIWGASLSYENVSSNSVLEVSQIWSAKLYTSGRISDRMFFHVVLQGMNKAYNNTNFNEANPYRDPEENIQNQFHLQLERVFNSSRVAYMQYSYIKNETVFNHWFYTKSLLEAGIKITL